MYTNKPSCKMFCCNDLRKYIFPNTLKYAYVKFANLFEKINEINKISM